MMNDGYIFIGEAFYPTYRNETRMVTSYVNGRPSTTMQTTLVFDHDGEILFEHQTDEIKTNFEGDKSKYSFSEIENWYDNYFIAYGSQKIKNEDTNNRNNKTRHVYFINKIKFE